MTNRTNPDNLTGAQIRELEKLNLLNKGMRDKKTNLPVVSSRKIAGPVKGVLRNTAEYAKKMKEAKKNMNKSKPKFKAIGGRINYRKGGGVCLRGMNREAVGKNS